MVVNITHIILVVPLVVQFKVDFFKFFYYISRMIYILTYFAFISSLFGLIGYRKIWNKLLMFTDKEYWTDYNVIEFSAWMAKAIIIVPGLIFGIEVWWLHFITLMTSSLLIWASMKKSLPTLILFNTIWMMISLTIIVRNIF